MIDVKTKYEFWQNNLTNAEWIGYVDSQKGPTEKWQDSWTEVARDRVHNLDLSIPEHKAIYASTLRTHIMFGEVNWKCERVPNEQFNFINNSDGNSFLIPSTPDINLKVYKDNKGLRTIGIGFNMDRPEARFEWEAALGKDVSFDIHSDLKTKIPITKEQAYQLLDYSIQTREQELSKIFPDWMLLKPNEKITIISIYYNSPSLVGPKFKYNIKEYINTGDELYLEKAFFEIKHQSNPKKNRNGEEISIQTRKAVQERMDREALMLESYKCPLYSKPKDTPIPDNASIQIIPGKTVVPRAGELAIDEQELNNYGEKKQYYIWRTKGDDKVRMKHKFFEDKIFHIDTPPSIGHPGEDYNCRCIRDFNIPSFVRVKHYSGKIIRKHITNLFNIPGFCIK